MATKTKKATATKPVAKKTTKKVSSKKVVQKANKSKKLTFNKFAIYFQTISILLAIAALTLNICDCIEISVMLDLFGLSVIFLAFSLFPKKNS